MLGQLSENGEAFSADRVLQQCEPIRCGIVKLSYRLGRLPTLTNQSSTEQLTPKWHGSKVKTKMDNTTRNAHNAIEKRALIRMRRHLIG